MTHCPNCGTAWTDGAGVCAHCGFVRPLSFGSGGAWPPAPLLGATPPPPRLLTGVGLWDYGLGLAPVLLLLLGPALLTLVAYGPGRLSGALLWLAVGLGVGAAVWKTSRRYPILKRGLGAGLLTSLVGLPLLVIVAVVSAANTFFSSLLSTPFKPCNF